jgi:hypothetical protein
VVLSLRKLPSTSAANTKIGIVKTFRIWISRLNFAWNY